MRHSFLQGTAAALAQNGLMLLEDGSIVPQDSVVAAATAAVGGAGDAVEATAAGEAGMEHFLLSTLKKSVRDSGSNSTGGGTISLANQVLSPTGKRHCQL